MIDKLNQAEGMLLVAGIFNIYVDDVNNKTSKDFSSQLDISNLKQYVNGKTHTSGHTLDLVIARHGELNVTDIHQIPMSSLNM